MYKKTNRIKMKTTNELVSKLNGLLAAYQIHYQNIRGLHWNIKGENFFELHVKYEELYIRTQDIIDDIAERLLSLEAEPLHKYADYLEKSALKENGKIYTGKEGVDYIVKAQKTILDLEREILHLSDDLNDEGTNAMMSDLIGEKEKTTWMFKAWLNKK